MMQLLEQEFGIKLPVRTVGKHFKRWGFTPQKPIKKAYEQCPEAVQAWLDEHYPAMAAQAKAEGRDIQQGDETVADQYRRPGSTLCATGPNVRYLWAGW